MEKIKKKKKKKTPFPLKLWLYIRIQNNKIWTFSWWNICRFNQMTFHDVVYK